MKNKQTHIGFIAPNVYPLFNPTVNGIFGGGEVDLYSISTYLASRDNIKVTFYVGDYGQADVEVINNVHCVKLKHFGRLDKNLVEKIEYHLALIKLLRTTEVDIMFTEMANEMMGFVAMFFLKRKGKRYIHRLASNKDTGRYLPEKFGSKWRYNYYVYGVRKADVIISQTKDQQDELMELLQVPSEIVGNGQWIKDTMDGAKDNNVLWVSRCHPVKQGEIFYKLAKANPTIRFTMIMPIYEETLSTTFVEETNKWLREAKKLKNFEYIKRVPFGEIQNYYDKAKVFVNTSSVEGFPNAFVQACMGATPILSLNVDPDSFLRNNQCGKSFNGNVEEMSNYIHHIMNDEAESDEYNQMSSNAKQYVLDYNNIEVVGKKYLDLI